VHAETSTGARSDAKALCEIAHDNVCITIVDAVTSLGGCELRVDEWEIDAIYSGTQKCLSAMPGISPVSFNERALTKVKNRKKPVTSWFLDLNLVMGYWGDGAQRTYHHTAPVNTLYGLHESLVNSQPPNEVTASTIVMQSLSCAILHSAFASERAPVEVSACTNAKIFASALSFKVCSTLSKETAVPQSSSTTICYGASNDWTP
jgi:kynureninase